MLEHRPSREETMETMPTYFLQPFQEKAVSIFIEKYGIDAGIQVISFFEKTGSLGKAMLDYCGYLRKEAR